MGKKFFDEYCFKGSYREVGLQYGEELREKMREMYEVNYDKILHKDGVYIDKLKETIAAYYKFCEPHFPGIIEQIRAQGESSGIGELGAMLINVSREIGAINAGRLMECTSYAVGGEYTADGKFYSGQNQDMDTGYDEQCSVVTFAVTGKPKVMFVLPAGHVAFSGMNSEGISCNRNFLFGSPWKFTFPRYFVTRAALENYDMKGVCGTMDKFDYPSSHHSLYADRYGNIVSYELDSQAFARGKFKGSFVHTNHFILPEMLKYEKRTKEMMKNSLTRLEFMKENFEAKKGSIDIAYIESLLSSHENGVDAVCVHERDGNHSTIASTVNCLSDNVMLAAKGNPCVNGYKEYRFK